MIFLVLVAMSISVANGCVIQPTGKPSIANIKLVWQKTQQKADSLRCQWTEIRHDVFNDKPTTYVYSLFLKNNDHFRFERINKQYDQSRKRNVTKTYYSTFNGREGRSFFGTDVVDHELYPAGFVSYSHSDWDNFHVLPLLFAFRPLNRQYSPILNAKYQIMNDMVEINDRKNFELRPVNQDSKKPIPEMWYFVDPERDYAITRVVQNWNGKTIWQLDISHNKDERTNLWIPKSWKLSVKRPNSSHSNAQNVEIDLDIEIADEQFVFQFPEYSFIADRTFTTALHYILGPDRKKQIITSQERSGGIRYLDYLATVKSSGQ